jgi:hypothetical protein
MRYEPKLYVICSRLPLRPEGESVGDIGVRPAEVGKPVCAEMGKPV